MDSLKARLTHWPTTGAGVALAGVAWWMLNSFHCQLPQDQTDWVKYLVSAAMALQGALSK